MKRIREEEDCTAVHTACLAARPQRFGVQLQALAACWYMQVNYMRIQSLISHLFSVKHRGFDGVLFNL